MSSQLHTKGPGEGTSLKMPPMLKTNDFGPHQEAAAANSAFLFLIGQLSLCHLLTRCSNGYHGEQTEKSSGHKHPEESDPVRVGRNRRHQARIHGTRRLMEEEEDDEEAGKNTQSTECDTAASARSEQKQRAVGGGRTEKK
ncbi:hypothetical protein F2P81_012438 [Scophthalmus maximus]|uniref:Uncharacterized protein n=1 Tax=Scophthalmus maximus TaxID=52904 RepID=A0A6A4SS44_SCOMX|nr:hypothetical protein F2P81_012438 [Scophthalmus maximus]